MASCCNSRGCDEFFDRRFAQRLAKRYRKRGVDRTARRIVQFVDERGVQGATVLEIGGGIGDIQLELLERGAAHTTNLELSPAYDEEARTLLRETGFEQQADRLIHDIAADRDGIAPVDVVILNRVVCCYPDYELLLSAAAEHSRRLLVFSYPPRNAISRLFVTVQNLLFTVRHKEFRVFTHPPSAMLAELERHGLRPTYAHRGLVWQVAGLERG